MVRTNPVAQLQLWMNSLRCIVRDDNRSYLLNIAPKKYTRKRDNRLMDGYWFKIWNSQDISYCDANLFSPKKKCYFISV